MSDMLAFALAVGAGNTYAGTVYAVHDGDTVHVAVVDPLLSTPVILAVRLLGINAPELSEPGGPEVRDYLEAFLPLGLVVTLAKLKSDKFGGRVDATLTTGDGTDVSQWLIARGYAVPWSGAGVKPHVPWPPIPQGG